MVQSRAGSAHGYRREYLFALGATALAGCATNPLEPTPTTEPSTTSTAPPTTTSDRPTTTTDAPRPTTTETDTPTTTELPPAAAEAERELERVERKFSQAYGRYVEQGDGDTLTDVTAGVTSFTANTVVSAANEVSETLCPVDPVTAEQESRVRSYANAVRLLQSMAYLQRPLGRSYFHTADAVRYLRDGLANSANTELSSAPDRHREAERAFGEIEAPVARDDVAGLGGTRADDFFAKVELLGTELNGLTAVRGTSARLSTQLDALASARAEYADGDYGVAERDAKAVVSALESLGDDLDAMSVPESLQSLVDSLAEQVATKRTEAADLEEQAARA